MNTITANQLKTKGITAIESNLTTDHELIITSHGKERFIVMDMDHYNYLRECELDTALHEARAEYKSGEFVTESVPQHIKRISK